MGSTVTVILVIWAASALAGYKIMESKGRSPAAGLVLGLLLGVFGLIICAFYSKTPAKKAEELGELRAIYSPTPPPSAYAAGVLARPQPSGSAEDPALEIRRLTVMHVKGELTDDEYDFLRAGAERRAAAPAAFSATPSTREPATEDAISFEFERLATMHDQAQLTDDEFAAAKRKVLGL